MYSTRATAIQHIAINRMLLEPAWVLGRPPGTAEVPNNHVNTNTTKRNNPQCISEPSTVEYQYNEILGTSEISLL